MFGATDKGPLIAHHPMPWIAEALTAVVRSPLGLLMLVISQKRALTKNQGNMSTAKLFQWFQGCTWSPESEKMTMNFLDHHASSHPTVVKKRP